MAMLLPGIRDDSRKYYQNGFIYYADTRDNRTLRCALRYRTQPHCPGRIKLNAEDDGIREERAHIDHMPDFLLVEKEEFKTELYTRARTSFDDFIEIFNSVSRL